MPPDLKEVRRWLAKADHDRLNVEFLLEQGKPLMDIAAFHCQQAVEKLLKAYLTFREHEFEKTHDVGALTKLCARYDREFEALLDDVEPLTAFAVRFRYPGPNDPSVAQVQRALQAVQRVREFLRPRISIESGPPGTPPEGAPPSSAP
jgi:HEPN domain-containing protein